jgi:hypothetical protein
MNRTLRMAALLAIAGCPGDPMLNHVFRVREDGKVDDDLEPGVHTGLDGRTVVVMPPSVLDPQPTIKAASLDVVTLGRERPATIFRSPVQPIRRTTWPPGKVPKDRSKAKAARKARKKNRGR